MEFIKKYFEDAKEILDQIDKDQVLSMISIINETRENNGRLFILGVGGGAGHASHAVNDFRKICGIESYTPTDNVSELTARINDDGWDTVYLNWLKGSRLKQEDMINILHKKPIQLRRLLQKLNIHNILLLHFQIQKIQRLHEDC